jgi:hypothetical protein
VTFNVSGNVGVFTSPLENLMGSLTSIGITSSPIGFGSAFFLFFLGVYSPPINVSANAGKTHLNKIAAITTPIATKNISVISFHYSFLSRGGNPFFIRLSCSWEKVGQLNLFIRARQSEAFAPRHSFPSKLWHFIILSLL